MSMSWNSFCAWAATWAASALDCLLDRHADDVAVLGDGDDLRQS
jgi:hypothetical protein